MLVDNLRPGLEYQVRYLRIISTQYLTISTHYIYIISNSIYALYLHYVPARWRLLRSPTRGGLALCGGACAPSLCAPASSPSSHTRRSAAYLHIFMTYLHISISTISTFPGEHGANSTLHAHSVAEVHLRYVQVRVVLYCTILCRTILYHTVLTCTILYCAAQVRAVPAGPGHPPGGEGGDGQRAEGDVPVSGAGAPLQHHHVDCQPGRHQQTRGAPGQVRH